MTNGVNIKATAPPEVLAAIRQGERPMFLSNEKGIIELRATKCAKFLTSHCGQDEDPLQLLNIFGHLTESKFREILSDSKLNDPIWKTATELGDTYPQLENLGISILETEFKDHIDRGWAIAAIDSAFGGESHIVGYSSSCEEVVTRLESIQRLLNYIRTRKQKKSYVDLTMGADQEAPSGGKSRQENNQDHFKGSGGSQPLQTRRHLARGHKKPATINTSGSISASYTRGPHSSYKARFETQIKPRTRPG